MLYCNISAVQCFRQEPGQPVLNRSPENYGWAKEQESWAPVWITFPEVSAACMELIRWNCKGDCSACKCDSANLDCSPLCRCNCIANNFVCCLRSCSNCKWLHPGNVLVYCVYIVLWWDDNLSICWILKLIQRMLTFYGRRRFWFVWLGFNLMKSAKANSKLAL